MSASITLAAAANGSTCLAKIVRVAPPGNGGAIQGVDPAPQVSRFRFRRCQFSDLSGLLAILRDASSRGEIVVRGVPKAELGRRAIYDDPEKGPAGLLVEPQWWFACDWDSLSFPAGSAHSPLLHPTALADLARPWLPPDARDKSMIVQVSASAGYKPGARFRTWHLLGYPLTGAELKLWFEPSIKRQKLDPAMFVEAQPHYLATTVVGGEDPCPERFTLIQGAGGESIPTSGLDRVKARVERERKAEEARLAAYQAARGPVPDDGRAMEVAIRKAESAISGAVEGGRHPTYKEQAARIHAIIKRHGGDWQAARQRLTRAYLSTLTGEEARQRAKDSVEGVMRWLEARE